MARTSIDGLSSIMWLSGSSLDLVCPQEASLNMYRSLLFCPLDELLILIGDPQVVYFLFFFFFKVILGLPGVGDHVIKERKGEAFLMVFSILSFAWLR